MHNPITHNFQCLLLHVVELLAAAQGGAPSLAAANALHLTTSLLKMIGEMAAPSTLVAVFEVPPNSKLPGVTGERCLCVSRGDSSCADSCSCSQLAQCVRQISIQAVMQPAGGLHSCQKLTVAPSAGVLPRRPGIADAPGSLLSVLPEQCSRQRQPVFTTAN